MAQLVIPETDAVTTFDLTAPQSVFAIDWPLFEKADIVVAVAGETLTQAQFTFSGIAVEGGFSGGTVTLNTAAPSGSRVTISRQVPIKRTEQFGPGMVSNSDRNAAFNRVVAMIQDLARRAGGGIALAPGDDFGAVPPFPGGAGAVLGVDDTGEWEWFANYLIELGGAGMATIPATAFSAALVANAGSAAEFREAIGAAGLDETGRWNFRGTYDPLAVYQIGDLVNSAGFLYVANVNDLQGVTPLGNPGSWTDLGIGGGSTGGSLTGGTIAGGPTPVLTLNGTGGSFNPLQLARNGTNEALLGTQGVGIFTVSNPSGAPGFYVVVTPSATRSWIAQSAVAPNPPTLRIDDTAGTANLDGLINAKGNGILWLQNGQLGVPAPGGTTKLFLAENVSGAFTTRGVISAADGIAFQSTSTDFQVLFRIPNVVNATAHPELVATTGFNTILRAASPSLANVSLDLQSKGNQPIRIGNGAGVVGFEVNVSGGGNARVMAVAQPATPYLEPNDTTGTSNLNIMIRGKGTGVVWMQSGEFGFLDPAAFTQAVFGDAYTIRGGMGADATNCLHVASANYSAIFRVRNVNSAVSTVDIVGTTGTNGPRIEAQGVATNIDLRLGGKGTGRVLVESSLALPSYTVGTAPSIGNTVGDIIWISNARAVVSGGSTQGAGAGTGAICSWSGANWQLAGTAITAAA